METSEIMESIRPNHIYHLACRTLAEIPDDSIDVIVTSPPYNLSHSHQRNKKHNMNGYGQFDDRLPQAEYERRQIESLNACARVIKATGSIFYNHKERQVKGVAISPFSWVLKSKCELVQTIIWDRQSTHNVDPVRLYPTDEYMFHLRKPGGKPRFNPECAIWGKVWRIPFNENSNIAHPAPFPVEIPLRCIQMADVPPGGVVLDPYMGSGSTALAAIELGFDWIGYEINQQYIDIAMRRIRQAQQEQEIWREVPSRKSTRKSRREVSKENDIFNEDVIQVPLSEAVRCA